MERVFITSLTVRLWAVMVLSLFAVSCSNDAFFGFEDLDAFDSFAEGDLCYDTTKQPSWQDSTYLDLEERSFVDFTEEDWNIYIEAEERLSFGYSQKGQCYILQTSGKDVNISDRLFNQIKANCENTNKIIESNINAERKIARNKSRNAESTLTGNDCVGRCIADYCGLDITYVNHEISSHYPQYNGGSGVPLSMLLEVVRIFKPSASEQSKFWPKDLFFGDKEIKGIIALFEHAVVVDKFKYRYLTDDYYIWGHDPQNSNMGFESKIYRNEVPASRESGGSIVIYKYIK